MLRQQVFFRLLVGEIWPQHGGTSSMMLFRGQEKQGTIAALTRKTSSARERIGAKTHAASAGASGERALTYRESETQKRIAVPYDNY